MTEELSRIILDTLKDFDYRLVGKRKLQNLWKPREEELSGLCVFSSKEKNVIYVRQNLKHEEFHHVQLHEFAHAYLHTINKMDVPEEEVDRLAYEWKQRMDGVYIRKNLDKGD